jgi:hypothetical protein
MKANGRMPDTMFVVYPDSTRVSILRKPHKDGGSYYWEYNIKTK